MKVAIYARVSTLDKGQDPEMQLAELRAHCFARGFAVVATLTDTCSGAKERRPALDELWKLARGRQIDAVCVWKLDRFARSLKQLVVSLAEFDALGVKFISLHDGFDLTTPGGRAMFGMVAVMAEFERALICERVRAGIANKRAQGKTWRRGPNRKYKAGKPSPSTLWRRAKREATQ
jgi:DNA invertase Pin-like site-specific DNA recombinase